MNLNKLILSALFFLSAGTKAAITDTAIEVTADSVYIDESAPAFNNCIADLVKSDTLFTYVFAPNLSTLGYCCPHTGNSNPSG
jgi:hypothetical protein